MPAERQAFPCLEDFVYAVVRTGGKQYRVQEGRPVRIERIAGNPGDTVELGEVLLMGEGADVKVGAPTLAGARVVGTISEQGRARKIVVFRYKSKTRSRKKTGHRQHFTSVMVSDILAAGQEPKPKRQPAAAAEPEAETPKRRGRGKKDVDAPVAEAAEPTAAPEVMAEEAAADPVEPAVAEAAEAPAAEGKPKRGRRKAE
jgi:large subunit ribosomal protein L21